MEENRHEIRIKCDEKCVLHLRDYYHSGMVENFSFGGALVCFNHYPSEIHVGDICKIKMNRGPFPEYNCKVVRVDNRKIGLKFTENYKPIAVEH